MQNKIIGPFFRGQLSRNLWLLTSMSSAIGTTVVVGVLVLPVMFLDDGDSADVE